MVERPNFRAKDPQDPMDWFVPRGSIPTSDNSLAKSMHRYLGTPDSLHLEPVPSKPSNLDVNKLDVVVQTEIIDRMNQLTNGSKREREAAKKYLVEKASHGSTNDLLDVTCVTVATMLVLTRPTEAAGLGEIGVRPQRSPEAIKSMRDFIGDLDDTLARECRAFTYHHDESTEETNKRNQAKDGLEALMKSLPKSAPGMLQYHLLRLALAFGFREDGSDEKDTIAFYPKLREEEIERLKQLAQKDPQVLSSEDIGLALKGLLHFDLLGLADNSVGEKVKKEVIEISSTAAVVLNKVFRRTEEADFLQTLRLYNACLRSPDVAVKNSSLRVLTGRPELSPQLITFKQTESKWLIQMQGYIERMALGDETLDSAIAEEIETMIVAVATQEGKQPIPTWFFFLRNAEEEYLKRTNQIEEITFDYNYALIDKLFKSNVQNSALDLLIKSYRKETDNMITGESLFDLFDGTSHHLGHFIDNLDAKWQDLRRITRDEMWPSFITARQAKIWPSERELDILEFSSRHPAEVLGFSTISFATRGYEPPEVGLQFGFKNTDKVLAGKLDRDGKLVDLPFDLEETLPPIHAFLEHIAVGSFQELVTIAEKRIKEAGHGGHVRVSQADSEAALYRVSVPRRETTYVTVTPHYQAVSMQSEEVIKQASERERLPKLYPQKVVPLAYSKLWEYLEEQLRQVIEKNASDEEIKDLEGQILLARSNVPHPSTGKVVNLPGQFELARFPDGAYRETWRVHHWRPKLKEGQEDELPEIFKKRFKAAPIALTKQLETWFTQAPVS